MFNLDTKVHTPKETRNIIDHYWYWKQEEIMADLERKRRNFSVLCCNLCNDFNISSTIRNANALGAKQVIIWGSKQYDRRGTVGTHKYTPIKHFKEECLQDLLEYIGESKIIGIDDNPDPKDITKPDWWQQKGPKECPTSYYSRCLEMLEEHDADCTRCRKQDQFKHTLRMLCGYSAPATQIRSCQEHQAWSQ